MRKTVKISASTWRRVGALSLRQELKAGHESPTTLRPYLKNVNILSFNGENSYEEVSVLSMAMRLATVICRNPRLDCLNEFLSGEQNPTAYRNLVGHLKDLKDPINPTEVFDMMVGARDGAADAFALIAGKKGGNGERYPLSLDDLLERRKNERNIFLDELEPCTLRDFKLSQSVAGVALSPTRLCDSRSVECRDHEIFSLLDQAAKVTDKLNPEGLATSRVKKIFGGDAYIRTTLSLNGSAENILNDIDTFTVNITAKAATIIYAYLGKDWADYKKSTVQVGARLAFLAGKAWENKEEYRSAFNSYTTSLNLWRMTLEDEANAEAVKEVRHHLLRCQTKTSEGEKKIDIQHLPVTADN